MKPILRLKIEVWRCILHSSLLTHYQVPDVQASERLLVKVEVHDDTGFPLPLVRPVVLKLVVVEHAADAVAQRAPRLSQFTVRLQILKPRFAHAQFLQQMKGLFCLCEGTLSLHSLFGYQSVGAVEYPSVDVSTYLFIDT